MTDNIKSFPIRDTLRQLFAKLDLHTASVREAKPPHNHDDGNWHWLDIDLLFHKLFSVFVVVAYATGKLCCVCMLFILIILWMSSHTESPSRCLHFACRKLQMIQTLCHSQQTLIIYNSVARRFHYANMLARWILTRPTREHLHTLLLYGLWKVGKLVLDSLYMFLHSGWFV